MADVCGRSVYVKVDLDAIENNIRVLRNLCPHPQKTGVIGVVKAGAYGHGSVGVSRHLKSVGVERLAVATVEEGEHLRAHGITGPIHVFGNILPVEMAACLAADLIPTVCSQEAVVAMATALEKSGCLNNNKIAKIDKRLGSVLRGSINIKIDSGMSRNGCQPSDLPALVKRCDDEGVPIDAMLTHFADSWGNPEFTQKQLSVFLSAIEPYRGKDILFHVANSGAVLRGYGTDLDFIRPGITVYGLPPDNACEEFRSFGLRPAGSLVGCPTLVKQLSPGRKVGYSGTYTTAGDEWVATIPIGYADGYWRSLSSRGVVIHDKTGERCPVIGRVSMDAISVRVPGEVSPSETFTLMSADYDPVTSACGIAEAVGTISYEVGTRLSTRLPRVYVHRGKTEGMKALNSSSY